MDIFALMDAAHSRGASDLHVSVGRRPVLRLGGGLVEIGDAVITPEDTVAMAKAVAPQRNYEELERGGNVNHSSESSARMVGRSKDSDRCDSV